MDINSCALKMHAWLVCSGFIFRDMLQTLSTLIFHIWYCHHVSHLHTSGNQTNLNQLSNNNRHHQRYMFTWNKTGEVSWFKIGLGLEKKWRIPFSCRRKIISIGLDLSYEGGPRLTLILSAELNHALTTSSSPIPKVLNKAWRASNHAWSSSPTQLLPWVMSV